MRILIRISNIEAETLFAIVNPKRYDHPRDIQCGSLPLGACTSILVLFLANSEKPRIEGLRKRDSTLPCCAGEVGRVVDGLGHRASATKTFKYKVMSDWQE